MEERDTETESDLKPAIIVSADGTALAEQAMAEFLRLADDALHRRGVFLACLSGGSTPALLYDLLAESDLAFDRTVFFFGDERDVPPDHPQSNYRLACEHLFRSASSKKAEVYRWRTEIGDHDSVAVEYQSTIIRIAASHGATIDTEFGTTPRFDVILLGIGADGHTASLFPHTNALSERQRIAVANFVPQLDAWRYTLTFSAINSARDVLFLAAGPTKSEAVRKVIKGGAEVSQVPAAGVRPINGKITWFLDQASAALIQD